MIRNLVKLTTVALSFATITYASASDLGASSALAERVLIVKCIGGNTNSGNFIIAESQWSQTASECRDLGGKLRIQKAIE
ncbi:hypothetical protein [Aliikangiella coralliicola]|uniref:C-type lectin domain-containing protein n=1 Tax=Aliikangiella coralliicola TaxID=2592383 RepID=A0A545UFU5_9GAMM|nr:hypothetical protein [Aliikangiella coralliicola]TQV88341.1 hypothetical protein FLL46_07390 [Aliikangiella coralliicola]